MSPSPQESSWQELRFLALCAGVSVEHLCQTVEAATQFARKSVAQSADVLSPFIHDDDLAAVVCGLWDDDFDVEVKQRPWNESEHPRDYHGRFESEGGASHSRAALHGRNFSTPLEATTWLQNTFEAAAKTLSVRERDRVVGFKTGTFDSINRVLRGDDDLSGLLLARTDAKGVLEYHPATKDEILSHEIPALDEIINRFSLPEPLIVQRATDAPIWHSPSDALKNQLISEAGYQSTSLWSGFVQRWHERKVKSGQYSRQSAILEIHLPRGQKVLPMQPIYKDFYTRDDNQYEMVLPRNGQMFVEDVIDHPSNYRRIIINWRGEKHGTTAP